VRSPQIEHSAPPRSANRMLKRGRSAGPAGLTGRRSGTTGAGGSGWETDSRIAGASARRGAVGVERVERVDWWQSGIGDDLPALDEARRARARRPPSRSWALGLGALGLGVASMPGGRVVSTCADSLRVIYFNNFLRTATGPSMGSGQRMARSSMQNENKRNHKQNGRRRSKPQ
jgi:hypothetical protein